MSKPDGGPAFPVLGRGDGSGNPFYGMSLRDWFAGLALKALLNPRWEVRREPSVYASDAYMYADAMIAEREKAQ